MVLAILAVVALIFAGLRLTRRTLNDQVRSAEERLAQKHDQETAELLGRIAENEKRFGEEAIAYKAALTNLRSSETEAKTERERYRNGMESVQKRLSVLETFDGKLWDRDVLVDPPAFIPQSQRRTRFIAIANLKGGVGKTTLCANTGMALARRGKNVLMVDLDFQGSLTRLCTSFQQLKERVRLKETIGSLFEMTGSASVEWLARLIQPVLNGPTDAGAGDLHFISAFDDLADVELRAEVRWLATWKPDVRFVLRRVMHTPRVLDHYDYVLFDCPPRLTTASINALCCADGVVVPVILDQQSTYPLSHMIGWLRRLSNVTEAQLIGVVANQCRYAGGELAASQRSILNQMSDYLTRHGHGEDKVFRALVRSDPETIAAAADAGRIATADDEAGELFADLVDRVAVADAYLTPPPDHTVDPHRIMGAVHHVRGLISEMDSNDIEEQKIDQTIDTLGGLSKRELDVVLERLGITTGAPAETPAEALSKIRQMLHNQAELTTRMRLMSEHR